MYVSEEHEEMLPDDVRPILMPDSKSEAMLLLLLLELGFYPTASED